MEDHIMAARKDVQTAATATQTERELVTRRVADANATVNGFVATLLEGVKGRVDDLKAEMSATLLAQRVSDTMVRLGEINVEVQALADQARSAADPVTRRMLLTQIAILKVSYTARYKAALASVPGGPDDATVTREVAKLFDAIVKDIAEGEFIGTIGDLPARASLTAAPAALPPGAEVVVEGVAMVAGSPEPPAASWDSDPAAGEGENPADAPEAEVLVVEEVVTAVTPPEPEPAEAEEPEPSMVPSVGLMGSNVRSRNGRQRSGARA